MADLVPSGGKPVVVTGAAGFIGFHVSRRLLEAGHDVIGIDNLNDYYDVGLKEARLARLKQFAGFQIHRRDIADREAMKDTFAKASEASIVIHLAAQAGVRHSLVDPYIYVHSNVMGQVVLLEEARRLKNLKHFVYASSSSVYGANTKTPFSVDDPVDMPNSLYAATKRADELIARTYAHLYRVPVTGLRFFTVYGPWGRPDMAAYLFADAIMADEPITIFNNGDMRRDFTFIDDIATGILAAASHIPAGSPPAAVYNLGNHKSEKLMDYVALLEVSLGRKAKLISAPMHPGDVQETYADIDASANDLGYRPQTPIGIGIPKFVEWYLDYRSGKLA
jgi:UDP-glucuronate 4-epimerase